MTDAFETRTATQIIVAHFMNGVSTAVDLQPRGQKMNIQ